jgi:hypothetical protein
MTTGIRQLAQVLTEPVAVDKTQRGQSSIPALDEARADKSNPAPRPAFLFHDPGDDLTKPWRRFPYYALMRLYSRPGRRKKTQDVETGRPAMFTRIFALTLALLTVTAPAHAACRMTIDQQRSANRAAIAGAILATPYP